MTSSAPAPDPAKTSTPSGSGGSGHQPLSHSNSGQTSLVQIGHYVLGETLGIGTFGKVKGMFNLRASLLMHLLAEICSKQCRSSNNSVIFKSIT